MSFKEDGLLKHMNESSRLDGRRRNADGEIDRKHGNTLVRTLRQMYGHDFAADCRADMKISTLLRENGVDSLSQYLKRNR